MPQAPVTKNFFSFNKGLNTESNEINFPDGFSSDERNYELLLDGSRRRRRGLQEESGGSGGESVAAITSTQKQNSHKWRTVAGAEDKHFIVHQNGAVLTFSDDSETISNTYHIEEINIASFLVDDVTYTEADVANEFCDFTDGRGYLLVTNKYITPFFITYDAVGDTFTTTEIDILIRDFDGIDDGVGIGVEPIDATIPTDHNYNLLNAGWKQADIDQFHTDTSKWPAKNAIWYRGYQRTSDTTVGAGAVHPDDGDRAWDSTKMDAEVFGNSLAARGSLFQNPFDTTAAQMTAEGSPIAITTWAFQGGDTPGTGGTIQVDVASAHGFINGESVTISGQLGYFEQTGGARASIMSYTRLNGSFVVANVTALTFDIEVLKQIKFDHWTDQFNKLGNIGGNATLINSSGVASSLGCTHIEYHQGHVFYLGFGSIEFADTITFSQVALTPAVFGACHQYQDPTDPAFNSLLPNDGGHIVIPKLGRVTGAKSVGGSLIIFSDNGIWEIGGGDRGAFTADGYSLRKITDAECDAALSPVVVEGGTIYTGPKGVYLINPTQSGLQAQNISEQLIQSKFNAIPSAYRKNIKTVYDDALRRVYLFYGNGTYSDETAADINEYRFALVLDIKVGAWYEYEFNMDSTNAILDIFAITDGDGAADNIKIKYQCRTASTVVETCDLNSTDYVDFDGQESPLPYAVTGWDNTGDFQRRKQAPLITVYAKRTETGYTDTGSGWSGDNESSNLLTGFWDWSDDTVSGKVTSQVETYRHVRAFVPASATDTDGYPVVTTRNKLRGRGRVLQLRFDGANTKDSHILGWTTNYKVSRKV